VTIKQTPLIERRRFLKTAGSVALAAPLATVAACSGGNDSAPAQSTEPAPRSDAPAETSAPAEAETTAAEATPEPESQGPMRLSLDDPQAKSLAYVHDATTVDSAAQPRYEDGQACSNCALFQGGAGDEWANCSIFPGRQVKATGWCSVYAPKPG
jgi:hypothetical protein